MKVLMDNCLVLIAAILLNHMAQATEPLPVDSSKLQSQACLQTELCRRDELLKDFSPSLRSQQRSCQSTRTCKHRKAMISPAKQLEIDSMILSEIFIKELNATGYHFQQISHNQWHLSEGIKDQLFEEEFCRGFPVRYIKNLTGFVLSDCLENLDLQDRLQRRIQQKNFESESEGFKSAEALNQFLTQLIEENKTDLAYVTGCYKIHLVPTDENYKQAIVRLLNEVKKRPVLQRVLSGFKAKVYYEQLARVTEKYVSVPKIVLYINGGKEDAQVSLDEIYDIFRDWKGPGRILKFNEQVTDFIFFTQGDRTDKLGSHTDNYYEDEKKIYFRSNITGVDVGLYGYHRVNPKTKTNSNKKATCCYDQS